MRMQTIITGIGDYTLIQSPNAPSRLLPRSESEMPQRKSRTTYWDRYVNAKKNYHLRPSQEVDAFTERFIGSWPSAALQMVGLLKEVSSSTCQLSPSVEPTSKRAYLATFGWLFRLFKSNEDLPCPDIVPSGDGGIDIEWTREKIFISVQIHKSRPQNDRIYFKRDGHSFSSEELKLDNLLALLNA